MMAGILVTGATGFLGSTLVRQLWRDGIDVIATGRNQKKLDMLPLPDHAKLALDLGVFEPAHSLFRFKGVTSIVHCAALSSPWGKDADFQTANVTATEKIIALAKVLRVEHLVHVSTPAVYFRFEDQLNVAEDMPLPKPVNSYARTKAIAEKRVMAGGLPYTIIRPRGIYGEGDAALLPRLLRAASAGPIPRFRQGSAVTDITYVADVVDALCGILSQRDKAAGKIFNISGGEALCIQHIVEQVCDANSVKVHWRDLPVRPALAAVRVNEFVARLRPGRPEPRITAYGLGIFAFSQTLDLTNAHRHLNWQPKVSFGQGLERTLSSQREGGS